LFGINIGDLDMNRNNSIVTNEVRY
jgi:hypothetical protein